MTKWARDLLPESSVTGFTRKARNKKCFCFMGRQKSIANLTVRGNYGDWLETCHFKTFLEAAIRPFWWIFSSSFGSRQMSYIISHFIKVTSRASLVAQWLRICLPMQGTWVRALVWEDPTCHGAAAPVSHNYWACASGACAPQQERLR